MKVPVKKTDRIKPPEGIHLARCIRIVDMGTQHNEKYNSSSRKVRLTFELVNEKHVFDEEKGPQPFLMDREYTLLLSKRATLRKVIEAWTSIKLEDGVDFDLESLINKPCQVQVQYSDDGEYANLESIVPVPKDTKVPQAENVTYLFDLDNFNEEVFATFPDWIKENIAKSPEYEGMTGEAKEEVSGDLDKVL